MRGEKILGELPTRITKRGKKLGFLPLFVYFVEFAKKQEFFLTSSHKK